MRTAYESALRRELSFHGFPWFPLTSATVRALEERGATLEEGYRVACDVANGFPLEDSLAANLLDDDDASTFTPRTAADERDIARWADDGGPF